MQKLIAVKSEKGEFYAQIETTEKIWAFLNDLSFLLFDDNSMIAEHYQSGIMDNDYFSFNKNGVYLIIVMTNSRAHLSIIGLQDNQEIKDYVFKHYSFGN